MDRSCHETSRTTRTARKAIDSMAFSIKEDGNGRSLNGKLAIALTLLAPLAWERMRTLFAFSGQTCMLL